MAKRSPKLPSTREDAVVAPSARIFVDWSPAKLRSVERSVESGNLSYAASVCDWLLSDDRVMGALDARLDQLFGLTPEFEPSGDKRRSNRAVKALEAGEDFYEAYPESELRLLHKWGLLLGVGLARHAWERNADHGGRLLAMPQHWHPQSLRWDAMTRQWLVLDAANVQHVVTAGDGEWILHTPYGASRPWAQGMWRALQYWVLLKHYARLDLARRGEKGAILVATSGNGNTKEQRAQLAAAMETAGSDLFVGLPAGFDLKMVEALANTENIYNSQIKSADTAIAILIRGGNLSTEVKEGSRAAAESQARTGDNAKLRFDAETLSTTTRQQSLVHWAEFNFGDRSLAPWPVWPVEPEEDLKASAETINVLGDGVKKLDDLGFEIDDEGLIERFRLSDIVTGRKSPEVRAQEAAERAALLPKPVAPGAPQDPKKKPEPGKAKAQAGLVARLASGAPLSDSPGMLPGQLYVDDVAESAAAAGIAALKPTTAAIAAVLDEAEDFEDVKTRLREAFPSMSAEDLAELVYRAMMLGELAGRHAVNQDA
jgi:phage gp29-like protein